MTCVPGKNCLAIDATSALSSFTGPLNSLTAVAEAGLGASLDVLQTVEDIASGNLNTLAASVTNNLVGTEIGGIFGVAEEQMAKITGLANKITGAVSTIDLITADGGISDMVTKHLGSIAPDPTGLLKNIDAVSGFCDQATDIYEGAVAAVNTTVTNVAEKALGPLNKVLGSASDAFGDLTGAFGEVSADLKKLGRLPMPSSPISTSKVVVSLASDGQGDIVKRSFDAVSTQPYTINNLEANADAVLGNITKQVELDEIADSFGVSNRRLGSGLGLVDPNVASGGAVRSLDILDDFKGEFGSARRFTEFADGVAKVEYPLTVNGPNADFPSSTTLSDPASLTAIESEFGVPAENRALSPEDFMGSALGSAEFTEALNNYKQVNAGFDPVEFTKLEEILRTGVWTDYAPGAASMSDAIEELLPDITLEVDEIAAALDECGAVIVDIIEKERTMRSKIPGWSDKAGKDLRVIEGFTNSVPFRKPDSTSVSMLKSLGSQGATRALIDSNSANNVLNDLGIPPTSRNNFV